MSGVADRLVSRAAGGLQDLGLTEDAAFVRKLRPSLVHARARVKLASGRMPVANTNPLVVVGVAFAVGIVAAKLIAPGRRRGR